MNGAPVILSAACCFPSGPRIELADTAVRAQLAMLRRHPDYVDSAGAQARSSFFPVDMPFDASRWGALAAASLAQLFDTLDRSERDHIQHRRCLLWLVLPDAVSRPGIPADLADAVASSVKHAAFTWERIEFCLGGHAAGVSALSHAAEALALEPETLAVVIGVESGLNAEALMWLDARPLLHGAHRAHRGRFRSEPYGRVPGEGAAAVAMTGRPVAGAHGWAKMLGVGTAHEPRTYDSGSVCIGMGLSRATQEALTQASQRGGDPISSVSVDLNGEPYRADQFGFTALRLAGKLTPGWQRIVPALASGDLDSASAVAHTALAAYGLQRRPQKANHLILASSDGPLRGAVLLGPGDSATVLEEIRPWRSPSTSTV